MSERMVITFESDSKNENFARVVVAAFMARLNPTMDELNDVKTAVSEAVTNCIVHAYEGEKGQIEIEGIIEENEITVIVKDAGVGIADIKAAMEPLYTTKPDEERSGMGFSFMEIFMDSLLVQSTPLVGTTVIMKKKVGEIVS